MPKIVREVIAELIGVAIFVSAIVGVNFSSPVSPLAGLAVAATIGVLIMLTNEVSGALLNPAVTLYLAVRRQIRWQKALIIVASQIAGAVLGSWVGGELHGRNLWTVNTASISNGQILSEVVATAGLVWVVAFLAARSKQKHIPVAVAAWVLAASTFTGSGAIANPAVTIGLMFTAVTGAGIGVEQGMYFILAQALGVLVALLLTNYVTPVSGKAKKKSKK
jgi:glycerol uptake facilitator-like aquaporin